MHTSIEVIKTALSEDATRYLLKELRAPYGPIKSGDYYSLREGDGREFARLDGSIVDLLVRDGTVKARPYGGEGYWRFDPIVRPA